MVSKPKYPCKKLYSVESRHSFDFFKWGPGMTFQSRIKLAERCRWINERLGPYGEQWLFDMNTVTFYFDDAQVAVEFKLLWM